MPYAKAAIHELRQMSARSASRKQSAAGSLSSRQGFMGASSSHQLPHHHHHINSRHFQQYSHGHNISQAAIHNNGEQDPSDAGGGSLDLPISSTHAASKPAVSGEGHIRITHQQQLHNQPYQSSTEKQNPRRQMKRQSTQDIIDQNSQQKSHHQQQSLISL